MYELKIIYLMENVDLQISSLTGKKKKTKNRILNFIKPQMIFFVVANLKESTIRLLSIVK